MKYLILDINKIHLVVAADCSHNKIREAILLKRVALKVGGQLRREYAKILKYLEFYRQLSLAGKLIYVDDKLVDVEHSVVGAMGIVSDDPHIIALARVSDVRLLCTEDQNLISDFKNKRFISNPRGKVVSDDRNISLLR